MNSKIMKGGVMIAALGLISNSEAMQHQATH